jgi:hypothetical protein
VDEEDPGGAAAWAQLCSAVNSSSRAGESAENTSASA